MAEGFVTVTTSGGGSVGYYLRSGECKIYVTSVTGQTDKTEIKEDWKQIERDEKQGNKGLGIRGRHDAQVRKNYTLTMPNSVSNEACIERVKKIIDQTPIKDCKYLICLHGGESGEVKQNKHVHLIVNERNLLTMKKERLFIKKEFLAGFKEKYKQEFAAEFSAGLVVNPRERVKTALWKAAPEMARSYTDSLKVVKELKGVEWFWGKLDGMSAAKSMEAIRLRNISDDKIRIPKELEDLVKGFNLSTAPGSGQEKNYIDWLEREVYQKDRFSDWNKAIRIRNVIVDRIKQNCTSLKDPLLAAGVLQAIRLKSAEKAKSAVQSKISSNLTDSSKAAVVRTPKVQNEANNANIECTAPLKSVSEDQATLLQQSFDGLRHRYQSYVGARNAWVEIANQKKSFFGASDDKNGELRSLASWYEKEIEKLHPYMKKAYETRLEIGRLESGMGSIFSRKKISRLKDSEISLNSQYKNAEKSLKAAFDKHKEDILKKFAPLEQREAAWVKSLQYAKFIEQRELTALLDYRYMLGGTVLDLASKGALCKGKLLKIHVLAPMQQGQRELCVLAFMVKEGQLAHVGNYNKQEASRLPQTDTNSHVLLSDEVKMIEYREQERGRGRGYQMER